MPVVLRVFLIFALVAILAGGIAMLGNQLGRKIGRRKMTVFGMRPRHTSIFITTITGSLIAVLTLAAAMLASKDVADLVKGTRERLVKLERREKQLLERIRQLDDEVRRGTVIWNHGERIALNTVPAGLSEEEVVEILGGLIKQSNDISLLKNNKIASNQKVKTFPLDTVFMKYSEEEFAAWVRKYSRLKEPVGVWTVVKQNCFFKDQVPVTVESFAVKVIFREGEEVHARDIRVESMLNDWYDFIGELKETALRGGMIEINNSLGGGASEQTLDEISQALATSDGRVRLRALAKRNLYQSSNLDVRLEVELDR